MIKRTCDLLIAVTAIVTLSPIMAVVAILIKLDSRGPVLYRAYRVGQHGREFRLCKFRTMTRNAHKQGPPSTAVSDHRITSAGRLLKRWGVDGLPQLLNVIKGDMSLVGPAPEDPTCVALYNSEQRRILDFRPGITSPAAITYRNEEQTHYYGGLSPTYIQRVVPAKVAIDLPYFERRTLCSDIAILGRAIRSVVVRRCVAMSASYLNRTQIPWLLVDASIVICGFYLALLLRFLDNLNENLTPHIRVLNLSLVVLVAVYVVVNYLWRLHRRFWRYASAPEVIAIFTACATSTAIIGLGDLVVGQGGRQRLPLSVVILGGFFTFSGMVVVRYRWRLVNGSWRRRRRRTHHTMRAIIYGGGDTGQLLARRLLTESAGAEYELIGFIDDDSGKRGLRVHNVPVLGTRDELQRVVEDKAVDLVILAMPNIGGEQLRTIVSTAQRTTAQIRITPNWVESMGGSKPNPLVREVRVEDLLGRQSVMVDTEACSKALHDKVVLVTGGSGSVGSELCRQILSFAPRRLLILDNNESALHDLEIELRAVCDSVEVLSLVGDITDEGKMNWVFSSACPQVIFHAAAYKHVPMMQQYPEEAVRVNVGGTLVVLDKARMYQAERVVLVSTDKAVQPESVMGATKRLAELLVLDAQWEPHSAHTDGAVSRKLACTAVRFGNVLGSRGSVVPTFAKQIDMGGPVTVTHPEMTRYFMEITEAATLIIQAAALTEGGEVFMLDMGERIRVDDLARKMIRLRGLRPETDIPIAYVGIRPGEKLHEELTFPEEDRKRTEHPLIYRVLGGAHEAPPDLDRSARALIRAAATEHRDEIVRQLMTLIQPTGCVPPRKQQVSADGEHSADRGKRAIPGKESNDLATADVSSH